MKNNLRIFSIVTISAVLLGVSSYTAFALKSDYDVKKQKLEQLQTEYRNQQRKVEEEIAAMPRNTDGDWKKVRDAENKLKEMPMSSEANQLIQELAPTASEKIKKDLETRIFYSKDILETQSIYEGLAKQEKDPIVKAQYEKSAKIMEQRKALLNQVEKDFKEGKGTYEELNKRIDELMAIDPCK